MVMSKITMAMNGILAGASGFALYCISPEESPCAFTACAFGLCHGLLGLIKSFNEDGDTCNTIYNISSSIIELIPLPLVNIQLYLASSSSNLALGHGLFIIPLGFDLIAKLFTEEGEDPNIETLKDLTILGNIVSLAFLAVNEDNPMFASLAFMAFFTKYGSMLFEYLLEGTGEQTNLFGHALFIGLTSQAIAPK